MNIVCAIVHCQMQRIDTGTAVCISIGVCICARNGISRVVPCVALAGEGIKHIMRAIIHGQVQSHDRITAIGGTTGVCVSRSACAGVIGHTVEPGQAVTGSLFVNARCGIFYNQMQAHNGVATIGGTTGVCVCWACRASVIGHTVEPGHTIAGHLLVNACGSVVHRQKHRHHAIATTYCLYGGGLRACLCKFNPIPKIW